MHAFGFQNIFAGGAAGNFGTSGSGNNTGLGFDALHSISSGSGNTAVGQGTLFANTTGSQNIAIGGQALQANTTGGNNVGIGIGALDSNTSGSGNIAIGVDAGLHVVTGNNNIFIGSQGVANDSSTNGVILIGTQGTHTNTFIAGISGATAASGVQVFVNSSGQLGTLTSSARFKQDIQAMDSVSEVLYSLETVTFRYKSELDSEGIPQFGLVAEEVAKVAPELVARDGQGKPYTVRYQAVDAMLLNEFLKQHRTVEKQKAEIQELTRSVAELKALLSKVTAAEEGSDK